MKKILTAAFLASALVMVFGLIGAAWYSYGSSNERSAEFAREVSESIRGKTKTFYLTDAQAGRYGFFVGMFQFGAGATIIGLGALWLAARRTRAKSQ